MTSTTLPAPDLDGWTLVGDFDGLGEFLASVGADSATWVDADPAALAAYEARVADDLALLDELEAAEAAEEAVTPTLTVVPEPGEPPAGASEHDRPEPEALPQWWGDPPDLDALPETPPAILARSDGRPLVPEGRYVTVYGRPGGAKSWFGLAAVAAAIRDGRRAILWDHESNIAEMFGRLRLLGVYRGPGDDLAGDPERFRYATGWSLDKSSVTAAVEWLGPSGVLALDSVGKSGGATNDSREFYEWFFDTVAPFRAEGCAVVAIDHTTKHVPKGGRPAGAIGSQARHAETDIGLLLEGRPWTKTTGGYVVARLEKDRYGDTGGRADEPIAVLRGTWQGDAFGLTIDPPAEGDTSPDGDLDRRLLEAVAEAGDAGIAGTRALRDAVKGRAAEVDAAAERLLQAGLIDWLEHGRSRLYFVTEAGLDALASGE